jgi:tRNA(fMet)-specific endonuclease VapC
MLARFLLDTNICIYIHRRSPSSVLERFRRLGAGEAVISAITYGELLCGAEKSSVRTKVVKIIEEFTGTVQVLPLSADVAQTYGKVRATLEKEGQVIGGNDLWIASHAKTLGLILVTNNVREFDRVSGLRVQNWIQ